MLEHIRLKLRNYKREPFSFLETLDCRYREHRFMLTVIEADDRVLHFALEPEDNLFKILEKVEKESCVLTVIVTDYKKHQHFYKELER